MGSSAKTCFHCGLINSVENQYPLSVNGKMEYMCCPGCQAVCGSILDLGLGDYYQFRESLPETSPKDISTEDNQFEFYDHEKILKKYVTAEADHNSIALMINGIVCSACSWLIETRILALAGVSKISINQSTSRATVSWDPQLISLSAILEAINKLGYQAQPYDQKLREQHLINEKKSALKRLIVAGLGMMQVMMYSLGFYLDVHQEMSGSTTLLLRWVSLLISAPVVFYSASPFYISAVKAVKNASVNMDVPVTIAIFSAWTASLYATLNMQGEVYFDSVSMFVFFLLSGRYLQMIAVHKTGRVLEERLKSKPETAIRLAAGKSKRVLLDDVITGDILLVKPGQQIPCDGVIVDGETSIDNAFLTGEAIPLHQFVGDKVAAGAINRGNVINIEVLSPANESTLAGIIDLLQKAQQSKPSIQLLADKMASYFVAGVLFLATLTALYWYQTDSTQLFNAVLAVLVVTCPCALSLATPVAITAGLGKLSEQSLLLNKTAALINLSELTDIVFDKTGTLTTGKFSRISLSNFSELPDAAILQIIQSIENGSEHPIATAFEVNLNSGEQENLLLAENISIIPSRGIKATIEGKAWQFGNEALLKESNFSAESPHIEVGQLLLFLLDDKGCQARVLIETEVRADAHEMIKGLKRRGLKVHLLSGDRQDNVQQLANKLDFENYKAEQTPQQKLDYIKHLQQGGKKAAMIGDGINDSPAMAAALVSFAIAKSTDITKVSSDLIMLGEKLNLVNDAIDTSISVRRIIKQNLIWALSYNLLGLPLAVSGLLSPWLAAAGMSLSSLVVVLNALRLTRKKV